MTINLNINTCQPAHAGNDLSKELSELTHKLRNSRLRLQVAIENHTSDRKDTNTWQTRLSPILRQK